MTQESGEGSGALAIAQGRLARGQDFVSQSKKSFFISIAPHSQVRVIVVWVKRVELREFF